jgi:hypothetical protein
VIRPALAAVAALAWSAASAANYAIIPDPTLTPGAVRTTDAVEICTYSTASSATGREEADDRILFEYACRSVSTPEVEIDHSSGRRRSGRRPQQVAGAAVFGRASLERRGQGPAGDEAA